MKVSSGKLNPRNRLYLILIFLLIVILTSVAFLSVNKINSKNNKIRLVTHNAFVFEPKLLRLFESRTGYKIELIQIGDVGTMVNKLMLTKNDPIGDVVFGLDNTYLPIAQKNQIIFGIPTATDSGEVCINYDKNWFQEHKINPPTNLEDLTSPKYRHLLVIENPNTSSTGLAFLAATEGKYQNGDWINFWNALKSNQIKIDNDWEKAYYTDFSGSSGKGAYPLVLSYNTSIADEIDSKGNPRTGNLLDGCFRQTEYIAPLKNGKNPKGSKSLIEFILSKDFQSTFPTQMYMFPVNKNASLPKNWQNVIVRPKSTYGDNLPIIAEESKWISAWNKIFQ